ncbi:hypothetical protein DVH24_028907 [Malus domestica]|uniref:Uncharacterized protein n=1 Tax=Malus domestica TaxID=3750 RepID=A0A498HRW5_MALDO|nr:hypothetical protein DVH24_028907 [Malus domestica]
MWLGFVRQWQGSKAWLHGEVEGMVQTMKVKRMERWNGRSGRVERGGAGVELAMEKVTAAKQFIENHYIAQMKNIQEWNERTKCVEDFEVVERKEVAEE